MALIASIIQISCPNGPEFLLLLVGMDSIPLKYSTLVCNILHTARLVIARKWKSATITTLVELNDVQHLHI